jgi:hypothetical protein
LKRLWVGNRISLPTIFRRRNQKQSFKMNKILVISTPHIAVKGIGADVDLLEGVCEEDFDQHKYATEYFYYSGPLDDKTRLFCAAMLRLNKMFTKEDLNALSKRLGYNVYEHAPLFNCRHKFRKVKARMVQDRPSIGQIKRDARIQDCVPYQLPFT